jgi:HAD superfamily hydrolase (TIGR01450 family)
MTISRLPDRLYPGYIFDLDGTLYVGDDLVPGAADAIAFLRRGGARVAFLTNKPLERARSYARKLTTFGIPADTDDVVTSLDALVVYLLDRPPRRAILAVGEPLVETVLQEAGFDVTARPADADVVVVSWDRTFNYDKLERAFRAVRGGARIVATNPDAFCPTPGGGLPDCAAMLAAIEVSSGARAEAIVGKPSPHMAGAVLRRLGLPADSVVMVGDRLATDVRMARSAGMLAALVLSGATADGDVAGATDVPDFVLTDVTQLIPRPHLSEATR